jgi:hypothetical protein
LTLDIQIAGDFLHAATLLVEGDRAETHGDRRETHEQIGKLWQAYMASKGASVELSGKDVAIMMALLKIVRMNHGTHNDDDAIDACGYMAIAGELAKPVKKDDAVVSKFPAMYGGLTAAE